MKSAKDNNTLSAIRALWLERADDASVSFSDVINRAIQTGYEYSPQGLAHFLNTVSSCVKYRGQEITSVDIERLDAKIAER